MSAKLLELSIQAQLIRYLRGLNLIISKANPRCTRKLIHSNFTRKYRKKYDRSTILIGKNWIYS